VGYSTRAPPALEVRLPASSFLAAPLKNAKQVLRARHTWALQRAPERIFPSSWRTGPPDFVGVGVQRSGTTWWYAAIEAHPEVHRVPGAPKERQFFEPFHAEPFTVASVERYHRLFPRPPGMVTGEWSPAYVYHYWTPRLLALAAPEARLLVLLRDPVERYLSAVTGDERNKRRSHRRASEAFERGLYFAQLSRLLEHFDREQVLVLQYERCRERPEEELRRTYAFLGLGDVAFVPDILHRGVNVTRTPKLELGEELLTSLREGYRRDAEALFTAFPELDPALWRALDPS
jgi:hypothetical protein